MEPIFIAGPDRSGTTLMYALLASHPDISMVRRTNMWRYFYGQYGDMSVPEDFEHCLDHMVRYNRMRHLQPDPERIRRDYWLGEPSYGRLFSLFHIHNAERVGKKRWGDKSLHTEHFADSVFKEFPNAKIIHMARDPRDRYASVRKRYGRDLRRVGAASARWLLSMRAAQRNEKKYPNAYKIVRFEDLASRPEEMLNSVCRFLNVPFVADMLNMDGAKDHKKSGGNSSFGQLKPGTISTKPIGRFRTVLDSSEIAFIQKVASREMSALGYQLESIQFDSVSERFTFLFKELPFSLMRMLGWIALFKVKVSRGISVPSSRLRSDEEMQVEYREKKSNEATINAESIKP